MQIQTTPIIDVVSHLENQAPCDGPAVSYAKYSELGAAGAIAIHTDSDEMRSRPEWTSVLLRVELCTNGLAIDFVVLDTHSIELDHALIRYVHQYILERTTQHCISGVVSKLKQPIPGAIYKAYMLERDPSVLESSLVDRPQIISAFTQSPWLGNNFVVIGPAGSGKSVGVLQAALSSHGIVTYVSARGIPAQLPVCEPAVPLHESGILMAELLNVIGAAQSAESMPRLHYLLSALDSTPTGGKQFLVVDDLDLISNATWRALFEGGFTPEASPAEVTTAYIMRRFSNELHEVSTRIGGIRVIPPDRFLVQPQELTLMTERQSFGPTSLEVLKSARDQMGGWLAGMQRIIDRQIIEGCSLDEYVLGELVSPHPYPTQSLIFALATFPYVSNEIAEGVEAASGTEFRSEPGLPLALPMVVLSTDDTKSPQAKMPEPLKESLNRLAAIHGDGERIKRLRRSGITYFVDHGDYESARRLAVDSQLVEHYLASMFDYCRSLALQEQWLEIRQLIEGIPIAEVQKHSDYFFWLILAHGYDGLWPEFEKLHRMIENKWSTSADSLLQGRAFLLDAWRAWRLSHIGETVALATSAFDILPVQAKSERLIAAGAAEIASRQLGDMASVNHWIAVSAESRALLPAVPEWWYMHGEFHRYGYMAMSGEITSAQQLAEFALENLDGDYPRSRFRYLLLIAYIELERGNLELARAALDRAEITIDGLESKKMHDLAMAHYWLAQGESERARSLLGAIRSPGHNRPDRNSHRLRLIAQMEMMQGNLQMAEDILTNLTNGDEHWPKYFGDIQHLVLRAILHIMQGNLELAILDSDRVINESQRRGHNTYEVAALAVQAEAFHEMGDALSRDRALLRLSILDPETSLVRSYMPLGRNVRTLAGISTHNGRLAERQAALKTLSARERELLESAALGLRGPELADKFFLSQSTVRNHLSAAYKKLGVKSLREAVLLIQPFQKNI